MSLRTTPFCAGAGAQPNSLSAPTNGRKKTNDSAAAVYVIFGSRLLPRAIKYVWSSTLAVGTRFDSPVYWRAKVVVLQRGPAEPGEWRQENVNFYQDYKDLFGFEPEKVRGIAVLSDSDTMTSVSEAAYDDFMLLPGKNPLPAQPGSCGGPHSP